MALIKKYPNTPANTVSWRAGLLKNDLNYLRTQAAAGNLDAQARLRMLESLENKPRT